MKKIVLCGFVVMLSGLIVIIVLILSSKNVALTQGEIVSVSTVTTMQRKAEVLPPTPTITQIKKKEKRPVPEAVKFSVRPQPIITNRPRFEK